MLRVIEKVFHFFRVLSLLVKSVYYRFQAGNKLIGKEFYSYGRKLSLKLLLRNDVARFIPLFCNPVSIVRYFEFHFALSANNWGQSTTWFDVSSPKLFLLYITDNFPNIRLKAINPNSDDLNDSMMHMTSLGFVSRVELSDIVCSNLVCADNSYDIVTSLSVIEHIPEPFDKDALLEMYRILKPGGLLVLTFPCCKEYLEEYRDHNVYGLESSIIGGKYFFQRIYDQNTIKSNIIDVIGSEPVDTKFFGEKKSGIYFSYEKRWIQFGLKETVKDPLHIVNDYTFYQDISSMPGIGVCGLVFCKGL